MMTMEEMKKMAPMYQQEAEERKAVQRAIAKVKMEKVTTELINDLAARVDAAVRDGQKHIREDSPRFIITEGRGFLVEETSKKLGSGPNKGGYYETLGDEIDLEMVKAYFKMHGVPLFIWPYAVWYPIVRGCQAVRFSVQFSL